MTKHIGIVACSVPGAALYYETISILKGHFRGGSIPV